MMQETYSNTTMNGARLEQLVAEIRGGRSDLFDELYRLTVQSVHWNAVKILKNDEDAWDVVQETYITAFKNLEKLQEPKAIRAWLQQIAVNISYHALRKSGRDPKLSLDDENTYYEPAAPESTMPETVADQESTRQIVGQIIEQLPEQQKETIILFYFDEMTVAQIAALMGCSENTVKSRLNYARQKIENQVRAEERRSGIRLYSATPSILLAAMELLAGKHPLSESTTLSIGQRIAEGCGYAAVLGTAGAAAAGTGTAVGSAGAASAGAGTAVGSAAAVATKAVGTGIGMKIAAGILAAAVTVGGVAGGIEIHRHQNEEKPALKPVREKIEATTGAEIAPPEETLPVLAEVELAAPVSEPETQEYNPMLAAYYQILAGKAEQYGICESATEGRGLAYTELLDFDNNGVSELYFYYITESDEGAKTPSLTEEIWCWDGAQVKNVFEESYGNVLGKPLELSRVIAADENNDLQLWYWRDTDVGMGHRHGYVTIANLRSETLDTTFVDDCYASSGAAGLSDSFLSLYGPDDPMETEIRLLFEMGSVTHNGIETEYGATDHPWSSTWEDYRDLETEEGTPHWYVFREKQLVDAGYELFRIREDSTTESYMAMSWEVNDVRGLLDTLRTYADTSNEIESVYYVVLHDLVDRVGFCTSETAGPGLAYAELIDFNNDGVDELYLYYLDTNHDNLDEADYPGLTSRYFQTSDGDTVWCLHEQIWYQEGMNARIAFSRLHASNKTASVISGGRMFFKEDDGSVLLGEMDFYGRYGDLYSGVSFYRFDGTSFVLIRDAYQMMANADAIRQYHPELMELYGISETPEEIDYDDVDLDSLVDGPYFFLESEMIQDDSQLYTAQETPWQVPTFEDYTGGNYEAAPDTPGWYISEYCRRQAAGEEIIHSTEFEPLSWKVNDASALLKRIRPMVSGDEATNTTDPLEVYRSVLEAASKDDNDFGHRSAALLRDLDNDGIQELIIFEPDLECYQITATLYDTDADGSCVAVYEGSGGFAGAGTYDAFLLTVDGHLYLGLRYSNYDSGTIEQWDLLALEDGSFHPEHVLEFYSSFNEDSSSYAEWGWLDDEAIGPEEYYAMLNTGEHILDYWSSETTAFDLLYSPPAV